LDLHKADLKARGTRQRDLPESPNSAAVTPLWLSWLEALMKRKFVDNCTSAKQITTLTVSAAPSNASASTEGNIQCENANTTIAAPNTITA